MQRLIPVGEPKTKVDDDKSNAQRLKVLDGWRGISVSLVILYHFVSIRFRDFFYTGNVTLGELHAQGLSGDFMIAKEFFARFMTYLGPMGVNIFFVISGFIITTLLQKEEAKHGSVSIGDFYKRRVFRIIPPLYVYLVAALVAGMHDLISVDQESVRHSAMFLCDISAVKCSWNVSHTWSLAVEEQFYLVWPFLFVLVSRRYRTHMAAFGLLIFTILAQMPQFAEHGKNIPIAFAYISAGVLVSVNGGARRLITEKVGKLIYCGVVAIFIGKPLIDHVSGAGAMITTAAMPVLLAIMVFKPLFCTGYVQRILETRLLTSIGLLSYSLYIWQQIFTASPEFYPSGSIFLNPVFFPIIALASYFLIEKPFVRVGSKFSFRVKTTAATA